MLFRSEKGGQLERKRINFDMTQEEHQSLKILAAKENKTIKELIYQALDSLFPNWRKEGKKED